MLSFRRGFADDDGTGLAGLLHACAFLTEGHGMVTDSLCFQPCGCDLLMGRHVYGARRRVLLRRGAQLTLYVSPFAFLR